MKKRNFGAFNTGNFPATIYECILLELLTKKICWKLTESKVNMTLLWFAEYLSQLGPTKLDLSNKSQFSKILLTPAIISLLLVKLYSLSYKHILY